MNDKPKVKRLVDGRVVWDQDNDPGYWRKRAEAAEARADALQAKVERLTGIMEGVGRWIDAYPLKVFPEPDFKRANELLKAGGMTLDAISASNMRHVLNGIKEIINADYGDAGIKD